MYHWMKVGDRVITPIDWEMTPELSFGTYESWGGRERVRDNNEKIYYFFIDGWGERPKVCLMERAVKHARVLAEIDVPLELVDDCVKSQGYVARFERSFSVNKRVRKWLIAHVLEGAGSSYVHPVLEKNVQENMGQPLPGKTGLYVAERIVLPSGNKVLTDNEVSDILVQWNFYDSKRNPDGGFANNLVCTGDEKSVIDERTGLQWQSKGLDICSTRMMEKRISSLNTEGFAGHDDWRLPSLEEAMSLMEPAKNFKSMYLHPCFSVEQPFVFVAAKRKPGGYWFVDYKQGSAFWASGTIPGGFGRLCRTL